MKRPSSREIIWQYAKEYHWMKSPNYRGNPWVDRFTKGNCEVIVRYGKSGRVTRAWTTSIHSSAPATPMVPANRNTVMDELERCL